MTLFYQEFSKILILLIFSIFLASIILFLSFRLSIYNPDVEKVSAYECGFDPYEDARNVFDVHFYIVCILFVVFDLETVFFLPWCMSFNTSTLESFWVMIDFIFELILGYFYVYNAGGLNWKFLK